jgi:hypothetical protein
MDTTRTTLETRAELASLEFMLALCKSEEAGLTVGQVMEAIDEDLATVRLAAQILIRDKRIEVARRDPPEDSLVTLSECEANGMMIRMLAQLKNKRAAVKAKDKRKAKAK